MGGVIGTVLMLLECSAIGAVVDIDTVPRPAHAPIERWLQSFPSYGFILSVPERNVKPVLDLFSGQGIAASAIGHTNASRVLRLRSGNNETDFWNLRETALIGFSNPARIEVSP